MRELPTYGWAVVYPLHISWRPRPWERWVRQCAYCARRMPDPPFATDGMCIHAWCDHCLTAADRTDWVHHLAALRTEAASRSVPEDSGVRPPMVDGEIPSRPPWGT